MSQVLLGVLRSIRPLGATLDELGHGYGGGNLTKTYKALDRLLRAGLVERQGHRVGTVWRAK